MKGEYIFTQICRYLPKVEFDWIVKKYKGNKSVKTFTCWKQLLALIFGQLARCESLRVLVSSLKAHESKLLARTFPSVTSPMRIVSAIRRYSRILLP